MSERKISPADLIKLAIAAARASVGEYTGLAVEGARHSQRIITLIITVVIGALLLFSTFIYAASKQIPGIEMLYEIGRKLNPPSGETSDITTVIPDSTVIIMPNKTMEGG